MEKVNVAFHDNGTVTFQHKKILRFVPEMSVDRNTKIVLPNIPLLVRLRPIGCNMCALVPKHLETRVMPSKIVRKSATTPVCTVQF